MRSLENRSPGVLDRGRDSNLTQHHQRRVGRALEPGGLVGDRGRYERLRGDGGRTLRTAVLLTVNVVLLAIGRCPCSKCCREGDAGRQSQTPRHLCSSVVSKDRGSSKLRLLPASSSATTAGRTPQPVAASSRLNPASRLALLSTLTTTGGRSNCGCSGMAGVMAGRRSERPGAGISTGGMLGSSPLRTEHPHDSASPRRFTAERPTRSIWSGPTRASIIAPLEASVIGAARP